MFAAMGCASGAAQTPPAANIDMTLDGAVRYRCRGPEITVGEMAVSASAGEYTYRGLGHEQGARGRLKVEGDTWTIESGPFAGSTWLRWPNGSMQEQSGGGSGVAIALGVPGLNCSKI
jgi:hypothetical protein